MYIPEFWCGVFAAVTIELVALVVAAFWIGAKRKKKEAEQRGILEV